MLETLQPEHRREKIILPQGRTALIGSINACWTRMYASFAPCGRAEGDPWGVVNPRFGVLRLLEPFLRTTPFSRALPQPIF